ncbi:HTH domain-containing protein (plasmid) [Butyrivibrio proteoclasticus B316]|uniref:HTH domain-containing protein n=1 Tax=Butyrivibrio proteoclasticus (strain ATCC 51982 / DSM 14932 / B316) TaxID=515622 RepID=E0S575_BUTPB|nr:helix-turn-helix domain-containing protein [Butyrivibrio proteoclasticus]ADL36557.1 HTH domain-containing protein [Butyrivibrio proteoclasticus B316]
MNPNEVTAARIKLLRSGLGLNQQEFANQFSEFINRTETLSMMTISNWETGRKLPPTDTIIWMCKFFNVSADYLLGLSSENAPSGASKSKKKVTSIDEQIEIPFNKLQDYDGKPVFITGPNGSLKPQWAILDYSKKTLICHDMKLALSPKLKYSTITPPELITIQSLAHHYLGLEDVRKMKDVFVESISPDPFLRGQVSGWYHHTPDKTCLVNEKGMTLSYEGLDVAYRVVDTKKSSKK